MYGGDGADNFELDGDGHIVHSGNGNDTVEMSGVDVNDGDILPPPVADSPLTIVVFGNAGDDTMNCHDDYSCMFYGGSGSDTLNGAGQDDILSGNGGNDFIFGYDGDDLIRGHGGDDEVDGGNGFDEVRGGVGDDIVRGSGDGDLIHGNSGTDECDDETHRTCEMPLSVP